MERVLLIAALALGSSETRAQSSAQLTVEVSGFRSDQGQLLIRLFNSEPLRAQGRHHLAHPRALPLRPEDYGGGSVSASIGALGTNSARIMLGSPKPRQRMKYQRIPTAP